MKTRNTITIAVLLVAAAIAIAIFSGRSKGQNKVFVLGEDFSNTHALEHFRTEDEAALGIKLEFVKNTFDVFDQKAS